MPQLDRYDERILDEDDYEVMSVGERLAAEEDLRRRDREQGIFRRDDRELFYDESDDEEGPRRKRRMAEKAAEGDNDEEIIESIENLEDTKGHDIKDWVVQVGPRTEIANRFKNFIRTFVNSKGQYIYKEKIRRMCENNQVKISFWLQVFAIGMFFFQSSFTVEFTNLVKKVPVLAFFLPEAPFPMLEIFDEVARNMVLAMYPSYDRVTNEIHVRISELPLIEELRTFR